MKIRLILLVLLSWSVSAWAADSDIRLNSLGFLPQRAKKATIVVNCCEFAVKRASNGEMVFTGKAAGPVHQDDVSQDAWIADFSPVTATGRFYLDVPGVGRSLEFEIGDAVYDFAFRTAMRAFYLWRCGTAVRAEHDGQTHAHAACHLEDGWQDYIGTENTRRDGTGGWHDDQEDYRTNEIAINWQAALVYALAGFTSGRSL